MYRFSICSGRKCLKKKYCKDRALAVQYVQYVQFAGKLGMLKVHITISKLSIQNKKLEHFRDKPYLDWTWRNGEFNTTSLKGLKT